MLRSLPSAIPRELWKSFYITSNRQVSKQTATVLNTPKNSLLSTVFKATGAGLVVGGLYVAYTIKNEQNAPTAPIHDSFDKKPFASVPRIPNVEIAREVTIPADKSGLEIILFQYPTCPFCCKVRAFLDFYGISYKVVEVNPVMRQQIKWSAYKKVPIVLIKNGNEYMQLNDSTMIISSLSTYLRSKNKISMNDVHQYYPITEDESSKNLNILNKYFVMGGNTDKKQLEIDSDERKWRRWSDEVLVHTLSPNVYRTKEEALDAFNWFSEVGEWDRLFSSWEKIVIVYVGAYMMYFIGKKLKKKYNLKNEVRQSLYDECNIWMKEVQSRGKFFGGKTPNLADLSIYGVLSSIEGCQAFQDLLQNTKIGSWYEEMKQAVKNHHGLNSL